MKGMIHRFSFPQEMHDEIAAEAQRLEVSVSWLLRRAWKTARKRLQEFPAPSQMVPIP